MKAAPSKKPSNTNPSKENELSISSLIDQVCDLENELNKEKKERIYYQLQSDKVMNYWENCKNEIEERKALITLKEREIEELEEKHQTEVKVLKQQVKHLLYEHRNEMRSNINRTETEKKEMEEKSNSQRKVVLHKENKKMRENLAEMERMHDEIINNMKMTQRDSLFRLQKEFEKTIKEIESDYQKEIVEIKKDAEIRMENDYFEISERKNEHINEMERKHNIAYDEMKSYYNEIFAQNINAIRILKKEIATLKSRDQVLQKQIIEFEKENSRLKAPLEKTKEAVNFLRKKLVHFDKDVHLLKATQERIKKTERELIPLRDQYERLKREFAETEKEKAELTEKMGITIDLVRNQREKKNLELEERITEFQETVQAKQIAILETIGNAGLDPNAAEELNDRIESVLEEKRRVINEMQTTLAKITKAHNDLLRVYDSRLTSFGFDIKEQFPLIANEMTLGPQPSDLV